MSTYVKFAEETGDRYLDALEKGQENILKYVSAVNKWTPRPASAVASMSTIKAFSAAGFDFSEKLLEQQKSFASMLFAQAAPKAAAAAKPSPVQAADSADKPASAPVVRSSKKKPAPRTKTTTAAKSGGGKR